MLRRLYIITLGCLAAALSACSVMSSQMRAEVDTSKSYQDLIQNPAASVGLNVILGGYILSVTNQHEKTTMMLLQAPLGFQDQPGQRDNSKGRLIVEYPGFLDPAVYAKDRKVTVGGRILESASRGGGDTPFPYIRIAATEIHLWPQPKPYDAYDPWWYYPPPYRYFEYPWYYPHYRHRHW
ncbi:MAG: Slp family lipoprotein [Desulfosarcinaceae bacterium]|jgi:outer membrane lipoprotein